jgi:hypothetical protein
MPEMATPQQLPAGSLLLVAGLVVFYLLPSLIALGRGIRGVVRLNLLLGWTGVGWFVALALACRPRPQVTRWP